VRETLGKGAHDWPAIDTDYEVVPWFQRYVLIFVAEDLETVRVVAVLGVLGGIFRVEAREETIDCAEHFMHGQRGFGACKGEQSDEDEQSSF